MNLEQIIAEVRRRADDEADERLIASSTDVPYLGTDEAIIDWANEAEREACVRADLLFDRVTPDVCRIQVAAGTERYAKHPKVWRIVGASHKLDSSTRVRALELRGLDWMDERACYPSFGVSRPSVLADDGRGHLHLWPTPQQDGELHLSVYRLPLEDMADPSDTPEIAEYHHPFLVDWILYRLWSRPDADLEDQPKAGTALATFTANFGERETARVYRRRNERKRAITRYGGIL